MLSRSLRLLIPLFLLSSAGCFNAPKPNCAFLCGENGLCPDEYMCGSDDRCHLVVNGAPAMCEDTLPGDASLDGTASDADESDAPAADAAEFDARPVDASPIDARPPDASPPDANTTDAPFAPDAFVNRPPVLGPISPAFARVAGDAVLSIQASATDPDAGQTLSFSALPTGTHRDPYQFRAAGDGVGGEFNVTTHVFTLPPGILGRFDVTFTVNDGATGSASQDVAITVTAHPVRINEVQAGATAAKRNLELKNTGATVADVAGWKVVVGAASVTLPPGATIGPDEFLVLHADTGTDTQTDLFGIAALDSLVTANEVAIYEDPGTETLSRLIRDYVKWDAGPGVLEQAVFAGNWPDGLPASFFDPTGINFNANGSIARDPASDDEDRSAWYAENDATLGAENVL